MDGLLLGAMAWAVILLAVAAAIGSIVAVAGRGRFAYAAALVWGLAWVAVARLSGADSSTVVAVAAATAAVVVALSTAVARVQASRTRSA